jgi:sugar lactone lactonase YvrE
LIGAVEVALRAGAEIAEGPMWDPGRSVLWWLDVLAGKINRLDYGTLENATLQVGETASALALRRDGSLLVAMQSGFGILAPDFSAVEHALPITEEWPHNRFNDGKADRQGRFWAGTMDFDGAAGRGTLYRLTPDWTCTPVVPGVTISNGIDWSPDGRLMYYVDTRAQRVDLFDFDGDTGELSNRRCFVSIDSREGTPDGLAVDTEGSLWLAVFGSGAVYRFDHSGRPTGKVELPCSSVSSCVFGGPTMEELFVTTAQLGLTEQQRMDQPLAGSIFRVAVGVPGQTVTVFGG